MLDFSKNYFELFGLPVGYIVDTDQLSTHYRELQRAVHPDRFANSTEQERRLSMQGSVRINEAYETLKDPVLRAGYLLSLNGINMEHGQETTRDAVFLMEQMELREELEAARDKPNPYQVIADFMSDVNRRINALIAQMAVQFEAATPDQLEAAKENLLKMQFLKKLRYEAESLEAELDDAL
ncbi:co-chaperone HscB [Sedimenticola sp.]|uniref:co-chaperone HscB n=1 Tax=Sedimenticola sp. TaxID=1940285 RepID=UPI003D0FFA98